MNNNFEAGRYAMCWYDKIPGDLSHGLELYYCKILKIGKNYATCELYHGEEFSLKRVKGIFNDVCVADLLKFE
jgi:hypothetical protein